MQKFSIVVLISGNGSNLQAIIDAISANVLHINLKAVISNTPTAFGLQRAAEAGICHHVVAASNFTSPQQYDEALYSCIKQYEPDLIVLAGFMRILTPEFLQHFEHKIVNIHPSLLPKYPGLKTHEQALADKIQEHGCSIHLVNEFLDAGPLIAQAAVKVAASDNISTLKEKVQSAEHFLYPTVLNWFANNRIRPSNTQILMDDVPLPSSGFKFLYT